VRNGQLVAEHEEAGASNSAPSIYELHDSDVGQQCTNRSDYDVSADPHDFEPLTLDKVT
jgi:hypothetical protein